MSDIKLFQINSDGVVQFKAGTVALEKSLQTLIEENLEALLGVRFLASEYSTGKKHGGRIDTLGIDENGCPVIIEYKRDLKENVINQGLYYLDWLMDHQAEFKLLVGEKIGIEDSNSIDWSSPRLLCIAGSFTKYDGYAIEQIDRNIELIRYALYGDGILLLEVAFRHGTRGGEARHGSTRTNHPEVGDLLENLSPELDDLWNALKEFLLGLGSADEVTLKETKLYVAFRKLKNFVCVRPTTKSLTLWVKVDPDSWELEDGFTRDVRSIGHYGTGDLEVTLHTLADLEKAKELLERAFEDN